MPKRSPHCSAVSNTAVTAVQPDGVIDLLRRDRSVFFSFHFEKAAQEVSLLDAPVILATLFHERTSLSNALHGKGSSRARALAPHPPLERIVSP